MSPRGRVSVLVTVRERPEPLEGLYEAYARVLRDAGFRHEFVVICQPWFRDLVAPLVRLAERGEPIRVLQPSHGTGEATMLKVAADRARGDILVTVPAYPRVHPEAVPAMLSRLDTADLALAVRWPRRDSWINRLQNRWFHRIVRWLTGSSFRDLACGVLAMRRRVLEDTPVYGDFFRFLPLLAQREGFEVVEVEAAQHPGDDQPRVYSPGVYLRRALDLLGLFFLLRFTDKPLRFFGLVGSASAFVGLAVLAVVSVQRLQGEPLADRPVLLLGVLLVVLGVQAVALGLIGEMIVYHHAHVRRRYRLAERIREVRPVTRAQGGDSSGPDDDRDGPPDGPTALEGAGLAAGAAPRTPDVSESRGHDASELRGRAASELRGRNTSESRPDATASAAAAARRPAGPGPRRARRGAWIRLAVGLGLLALLFSRVDFSERTVALGPDVLGALAVTWVLLLLAQAVSALRWREILGDRSAGWAYLFRLYLVGNFFSLFLPTSVGGDAVRAVAATRALPPRAAAVTSVIVDRLVGVAALGAYLVVGLLVAPAVVTDAVRAAEWATPGRWLVVAGALLALGAAAAGTWLARTRAVRARLAPARSLFLRLRRAPRTSLAVAGLSLLVQGLYIVTWATLAAALGLRLPMLLFIAAVPVVSLLAMLPVSVSGLGVREGAWLLILTPLGVPAADAVAFSLVFFVAFALVGVVGGVAYSLLGTTPRGVPAETPT